MLLKYFSRLSDKFVFLVLLYIFSHIFVPTLVEAGPMINVFINEIHYDNEGADVNEFVEIVGDANIDLTGWSLLLYNGNNGEMYKSFNFDSWSYIDTNTQFGFHAIKTIGIQNGSPDGVALFDGTDIIQFLSYEGSFTASDGIAKGITSIDIGVSESFNTPVGFSLQLTGQGSSYDDFAWSSPQESTFDSSNLGQQFIKPNGKSILVSEPGSLLLLSLVLISILYCQKGIAPPFIRRIFVHPQCEAVEGNG